MANAALKDVIARVADVVENITVKVEDFAENVVEFLESVSVGLEKLDSDLDRTLNDEQAQPAGATGPVADSDPSLEDMIDYLYKKVAHLGVDEDIFKSSVRQHPELVRASYEKYKSREGR